VTVRREQWGPHLASEEGEPVLTTAPCSQDHGDENTGRLSIRIAVEGVPRERGNERVRHTDICLSLAETASA